MSELLQKLEDGMRKRSAELTAEERSELWGELAKTCYAIMLEDRNTIAVNAGWLTKKEAADL